MCISTEDADAYAFLIMVMYIATITVQSMLSSQKKVRYNDPYRIYGTEKPSDFDNFMINSYWALLCASIFIGIIIRSTLIIIGQHC